MVAAVLATLLAAVRPTVAAAADARPDLVNGFCIAAMTSDASQLDALAETLGGRRLTSTRRWVGPATHRADFEFADGATAKFYWNDAYTSLDCYLELPGVSLDDVERRDLFSTRGYGTAPGQVAWTRNPLCEHGPFLRVTPEEDRGICADLVRDERGPRPQSSIYLTFNWAKAAKGPAIPVRADVVVAESALTRALFDYCIPTVAESGALFDISANPDWPAFPSPYKPEDSVRDHTRRWGHASADILVSNSYDGLGCNVLGQFSPQDGVAHRLRERLAAMSATAPADEESDSGRTTIYELGNVARDFTVTILVKEHGLPHDGMLEIIVARGNGIFLVRP